MDSNEARIAFESGKLAEVRVEPADAGNGWAVVFKTEAGTDVMLTDHSGSERIYHTLDHATEVAKSIGFHTVHVDERF